VFDGANLKQRVFKNKKCQRIFFQNNYFFNLRGIIVLEIRCLQHVLGLTQFQTNCIAPPGVCLHLERMFEK
jgi:hypothetical protein